MQDLIDGLRASGLDPIILDENTDLVEVLGNRLRTYETNAEFVTRIMEFGCPTGVLIQAFVMEALRRYADETMASDAVWDNGLISSAVWRETAAFLKAEIARKYGA